MVDPHRLEQKSSLFLYVDFVKYSTFLAMKPHVEIAKSAIYVYPKVTGLYKYCN